MAWQERRNIDWNGRVPIHGSDSARLRAFLQTFMHQMVLTTHLRHSGGAMHAWCEIKSVELPCEMVGVVRVKMVGVVRVKGLALAPQARSTPRSASEQCFRQFLRKRNCIKMC